MSQFKTPKTKINDLELETQPKLNNFKPSIEIHKPEMLKLKEDADPQTGYSEYFQQSNNVNLKIIGNTVPESPSININSITGINLNAQTTVLGTVSADGYLVNGVPLARVTYTGNYLDLINTPVLIGSYAQLNNTSVQVWTGPQLFSQVQSSNVPKYSNDLITKSYADTTYSTKPATDYVLGGIRVPLTNNALSIASNGSLQTNVDNTTIFINNQNKLSVIYPSVTGVSSVSNRDGTINISGSRENPIISLNLDHTSVWTQDQNFTEDVSILGNLFVDSLIVQGSPLSKVAITGKYNDLLGKPNLTDVAYIIANNTWTGTNIFNSTTKVPTISGTTDNTTSAASTAFVQAVAALKAPLNSPAFTGIPTAPTAPVGTNTTQLATTAFANGVTPVNTKYDFIVTGDNTPTFAAGEEYILYPSNIGGYVEVELTFLGRYKTGATTIGDVTAKFSIDHNYELSYYIANIKLLSLGQSSLAGQNLTNLLTFTSYLTTAPYVINGVTIPTGQIIYTIKLNNALTYSGTTNSIYAKVSSNALDANNVMNGALAPAVLGIVSTPIPALAMTKEGEDEIVGATTVIKADNALFQSSMNSNNFGTNPTTGLTTSTNILNATTTINPAANAYIMLLPFNCNNANVKINIYLSWTSNAVELEVDTIRNVIKINNLVTPEGNINTIPLFNTLFTFEFIDNGYWALKSLTAITGLNFIVKYISDTPTPAANIPLIGTIFTPASSATKPNPWASQVGLDNTTINVNAVTGLTQIAPNTTAVNKTLHSTSSSVPAWVQNTVAECSDYVTGTFTPVFGGGTTAGTYTPTGLVATYTKIGNLVTLFCSVGGFTAASGGVGTFKIRSGLPFQPVVATNPSVGSITYGGITLPTNDILSFVVLNSGSIGFIVNHAGALAGLNPALITTTSTFGFTITYKIA